MASLRDIRKRIRSVKNTQQITKAMKMVAAAKLRKAQDAILAARPYAQALDRMMADLASANSEGQTSHPLLVPRAATGARKIELLVLTSDRGLAGGFNSNVLRRVSRYLNETRGAQIRLSTVGRKGHDFFKRRVTIRRDYPGLYGRLGYSVAQGIAEELTQAYLSGEVDEVHIVYNEFISPITQKVVVAPLLPLQPPASEGADARKAAGAGGSATEYEYEPSPAGVLERLVPQSIAIKIYRALLESVASEHGARMSAMENATSNASDMIGKLTLYYNRTRQAVITKELMEIVSGAEALK